MKRTNLALIGICGGAMGLFSLGAQAAPLGATPDAAMIAGHDQAAPQSVAYRRCWWRNGTRHCRWYGSRSHRSYGYTGPTYPEAYRPGSNRWWQEMDRDERGGRGRP
jgi:hypothetical protein